MLLQATKFAINSRRAVVFTLLFCAVVSSLLSGCSRRNYRLWADRDAYELINSRQCDRQWDIPDRSVEPAPQSRMADANDPDCNPLPPDDPAAACYMRNLHNGRNPVRYWDQRGHQGSIDDRSWESTLPYDESGVLKLDKQLAVDLALVHNRDFQTQVEALYVQALNLSENRFEFDVNWFGGSDGAFVANGDGANAVRGLSESNNLGFTKDFASGGQLMTNLVNNFTWQLGGNGNSNFAASSLLFSLTQPLLRGAFRHVRTEGLTQAERNLLYNVRDFARFRRLFYFDIVSQYLDLLNQTQAVRNEEENLSNLELNYEEHKVLLKRDLASPVRVDQVFQNFQTGRLTLINTKQALQSALDNFKFNLGLPARVEIKFDESLLEPFRLNTTPLVELQSDVDDLKQSLLQYVPPDEPPEAFVSETYEKIKTVSAVLKKLKTGVDEEFENWVQLTKQAAGTQNEADRVDNQQQILLQKQLKLVLEDLDESISDADEIYEEALSEFEMETDEEESDSVNDWKKLETLIVNRGGLKERVTTLLLLQTQIRLFSIELKPLNLEQEAAVEIALQRRLDLKNSRGAVTDAYRGVEIAADQLESDLDVTASAELGTDNDNAFRFDSDANQYNLEVAFDGPLNRFSERNDYRIAQISYQQQRRQYMADEDAIVNSVRLNLRQLRANRSFFQITRQTLISNARRVEEAQFSLRTSTSGDSSLTQDLLQALEDLRDTKNALITNWINYETSRIALFVDLESLQLNEQGVWINEDDNFGVVPPPVSMRESDNEPNPQRLPFEEDEESADEESIDIEGPGPDVEGPDVEGPIERIDRDLDRLDPSGPSGSQTRTPAAAVDVVADRRVGGLLDLR